MLRLKLDPAKAVPAMISYQHHENADPEAFYEGRTWPTEDGFAYIICHDCGELDEEGQFFEKNTVYPTRGDFTARPDERCNVCKGYAFSRIRFRLSTSCSPNSRRKSPKVSGLVRECSHFAETIGGDWFDHDCRPTRAAHLPHQTVWPTSRTA
jgi:hypothetical protein